MFDIARGFGDAMRIEKALGKKPFSQELGTDRDR